MRALLGRGGNVGRVLPKANEPACARVPQPGVGVGGPSLRSAGDDDICWQVMVGTASPSAASPGFEVRQLGPVARTVGAHLIFVQAEVGDAPANALYSRYSKPLAARHYEIEIGCEAGAWTGSSC